ncbi:DUF5998 family protein [Schaalia vaccimaxillae]|uniref:DUF5998 family protein n=1 Tax=Schaalia vaccimaxillae TaxID=183916 RepID=UPI0003B50C58|nr:DUF5998 family protein [Schaalia vaccimaxillae]
MDTWARIERAGFYPQIAKRALRRALRGTEPLATLCQVDAAFDRGSVFRHLTVATLTSSCLIHVHIDELESGGAGVATAIHPISSIMGASMMEVVDRPEISCEVSELTIAINVGGQRRTEIEPAHCDDPQCTADHGYSASTFPDDLTIRISGAADGVDVLAEAEQFVDHLYRLIGQNHA